MRTSTRPGVAWLFVLGVALATGAGAAPSPEQIKEVARDLVCLCGTCNRESLSTCLCGHATGEREEIGSMINAGMSRQAIVDDFVERHGPMVLSEPPEGYDVVWVVPFLVLAVGVVGVCQVLVLWRRDRTPRVVSPAPAEKAARNPASHEVDRLRRDLEGFDDA